MAGVLTGLIGMRIRTVHFVRVRVEAMEIQ